MNELLYDCCPRCGLELYFCPVASLFDPVGERFGFYLQCKSCGWHSLDRFYSVDDVTMIKKSKGSAVEVLD